jgi:hypothetical protein
VICNIMYYGVVETPKFKRAFKLSCQTRGRITKRGNHNGTQADVGPVFHIYTAKIPEKELENSTIHDEHQ